MACRTPMFLAKGFVPSMGHTAAQSAQPVHFSGSTLRVLRVTSTLKSPGEPENPVTSESTLSSMLGWRPASTSLGARMHVEQSLVGKVLSSCAIAPPIDGLLSPRDTLNPASARSSAACVPAMPPPTTSTAPTWSFMAILCSSERAVVRVQSLYPCDSEQVPLAEPDDVAHDLLGGALELLRELRHRPLPPRARDEDAVAGVLRVERVRHEALE